MQAAFFFIYIMHPRDTMKKEKPRAVSPVRGTWFSVLASLFYLFSSVSGEIPLRGRIAFFQKFSNASGSVITSAGRATPPE